MRKKAWQMVMRAGPLILLLLAVAGINAFAFLGFGNSMSWKEEVLLHDGTKMVVERVYHLGGKPTLDSHEQRALDETVSSILPGTNKKIIWKTDFRDSQPEPNSLNLLVLDRINDTPFIAAYPVGCIAYNKWGRPNPPYIFLKYEGDEWKRIPLEEFPAELSKVNVIVGRPPAKLLKAFYTVDQVEEQNRDINRKEYENIIQTPLEEKDLCPDYSSQRYRSLKAPFPISAPNDKSDGK